MADYKIELGINFTGDKELNNIKKQLTNLTDNTHRIRIDVDNSRLLKQIEHAKKELKELNSAKGNQPSLTVNTQSLEKSLSRVADVIDEVRKTLGTLDDKSGMKSLLSSVNQIATALGKVENESDSLLKSLSALSKKDFSINFDVNFGDANKPLNPTTYGRKARKQIIPELDSQIEYLEKSLKQSLLDEAEAVQKAANNAIKKFKYPNGKNKTISLSAQDLLGLEISKDADWNKAFADLDDSSYIKKMEAREKHIEKLIGLANTKGINLDGFYSQFSKGATELIDDVAGLENAADKAEDINKKIKNLFGGSLDVEGLSGQLQPIIADLGEIKTALQSLSSNNAIDGLTQSFNRLSETLEKLTANLTLAKNTLDTGFSGVSNISSGVIDNIEKISDSSTAAIVQNEKKKQEAYKATADTVMYHAGIISKLNKAETNGRFYGSNRGTGYFGTGHYFVDSATKHELDDSYSYNKLPYTSIDISQYDNLFRVTSDEIGYALHSFLGNLTRFTQGSDNFDVDELFVQFKNVFGDVVMDVKEFGSRIAQLKTFMSNSDFYDRSDSVSTQFMKSLGYGGVDTRGTSLADTRYGTVIYDLKEESVLQANITDELQKQGQMLEKINYERGQVFDKDTDARIQKQLDEQIKQREINEEFEKIYGSGDVGDAYRKLSDAQNRLQEIDNLISDYKREIDYVEDRTAKFEKEMQDFGLELSDEDIEDFQKRHIENFESSINELLQEKAKLESEIPSLEDADRRETQLVNEAYEQAKQIVEQRHLEAQQAQETANVVVQSEERKQQAIKQTDDVVDQQVTELMQKYSIAGDKGSDSFNKIKQALFECRNELEIIKNGNFDVDEQAFGNSAAVDKVTNAISEQMQVVEKTAKSYGRLSDYIKDYHNNGYKVHIPDSIKQEYGDDYNRMAKELSSRVFTSGAGEDFEVFISQLNENLGETISLSNGAEAAFKQLYDEVLYDRQQAKAQSKQKGTLLSEDELIDRNYLSREEVYDDVMSAVNAMEAAEREIAQSSTVTTNTVSQNEERKQQAYRETSGVIENLKTTLETMRVDRSSIDTVIKDMEELGFIATDTSVKMKNGGFDITVKGIDSIGRAITEIRHLDSATDEISLVDRKITQSLTETDRFVKQQKQAVSNLTNQINQLNRSAIDQNASRPIKDSAHLDALADKYDEITLAIQRMENASSDTFVDEQNNVKALISDYKSLVSEFKNAENVSSKMKGTDFASGLDIAKNDLEKFKAQAKDFPQITATVEDLDRAIEGVGDAASLNKFNDQLRVARSELAKVKSETTALNRSEKVGINVSGLESKIADLQRISPEIDKFEAEIDGAKVSVQSLLNDLRQVNTQSDFSVVNSKWRAFADAAKAAGIAVTETATKARTALANDIKFDIDVGNFENEVDEMYAKFNRLSDANTELRNSVELVENAYQKMLAAANANTGDEVADREKLIQAEKEYAAALEKTNNLIKIQARADKIDADKIKLQDNREKFQAKIDAWMANNSAATKKFGAQLLDLRAKAENADQVNLNHLEAELYKIDKAADKAGLKMQSLGDQIKSKFKEYMAYFSVAEVFMYVEQGLREMFNTVKEIDTAMTGLYRVTDLTAAQYDTLFNNMISSAKEYGATLNDIINATTDWVRAGFDADVALGMAEVTTMYQHISDLDYDTAAENLITAYNGFKDELNGAFDGDQVAAVNYIADVLNELDNNFAVTSAGLGEALKRSASALDLAGNSIQETAGMVTGIAEVTQDPEKAGNALKVLSLRLRGKRIMPPYKVICMLCA